MVCTPTSSVLGLTIKGRSGLGFAIMVQRWYWAKKCLSEWPAGSVDAVVRASGMPCKDHAANVTFPSSFFVNWQMSPFCSCPCRARSLANELEQSLVDRWERGNQRIRYHVNPVWRMSLYHGVVNCSALDTVRDEQGWSVWLTWNRGGQKGRPRSFWQETM